MVVPFHVSSRVVSSGQVTVGAGAGFVLLLGSTTATVPAVYSGVLLVAAAFVVGPSVTLGGAAGVVIHDLFRGAVGPLTAELAVWLLAFAGVVAWLDSDDSPDAPAWGAGSRLLACAVAGVYATAAAAWFAMVLGGERFYASGMDFLPGVLVVAVVGALAGGRFRETVPSLFEADAGRDPGLADPDSGTTRTRRFDRRRGAALLGLLAIGVLWLVGAMGLDAFAHDLALFDSETQLRNYAGTLFGTGTAFATAGASVVVWVYRYGDLVVRLSPLLVGCVLLSLRWLVRRRRRPNRGTDTLDRRPTDD
ncbi:hypothetical protein [Haloarcula laminariae]|uniref:hypothetical protein n=1 Tax=Haloarcula laminariae TaxID=2961577 RepID=UPI002406A95B|nr:hypothetical protein [Halomicroarcula sp. FL173]